MSWNEPGGGDKKDPWSGRGSEKGPPDLDEAIRSLQEKLGGIFGGGGNNEPGSSMKSIGYLAAGAVVLWGLSGFYIVDEGNHGVVTRFGKFTDTTQAGLNWHMPAPIEQVQIVNVKQQRFIEVGYRSGGAQQTLGSVPREALMLTKDENIVDVRLAVQYQVKDAKQFLFNVANPSETLKQVTESAERGVIGSSNMDFVLTEGRSEIVAQIGKEIQEVMDAYQSGIQITSVNLQDAQPPEPVQGAFEDAIKAREDQQRLINEAQAYSNDVVPKARGAAARKSQEAEGYKEQVIAQAEGEATRFTNLLVEYKKAPDITRRRLYIETIESVLSKTNTVMIDVKGGNNLLYLPIDKLAKQPVPNVETINLPQPSLSQPQPVENIQRGAVRGRDVRGRQ
ncbi:FtsH protease activity modulator HflK [Methylicorpusculum oleiharenae]|uniref:FtsH protease activity modulator HflK n=1 Tax=Methylicorpusculum oleiharenae TaxID=1338687 RepID=UPI00135769FC|nr:FtsH protease activity modulator HflK [Methylicorpusculum oleiharenae]MCD2451712.1 FtsH protease activity modulator HflK [Methylicorpusculum oleiharenae]